MGLMWFQIGQGDVTEVDVNDIVAALFFLLVFNSFNSLFDVLMICKLAFMAFYHKMYSLIKLFMAIGLLL